MISAEKIPNNVNLSGNKRLQRALEHWQPKYIQWWHDMGPQGFQDYHQVYVRTATSVDEIRARVRADGITHLLVRHDILLDYERSPIVDERRPRQENVAKLELMTAFFTQDTRVIKGDRKFWLIELPPARPH